MVREQDRGKPHFNELPCAVQSFEELREGGYRYVDKTDLIWEISHGAKVQFFARPRRFGKSLMISTLKSYFEGRGDLFEGLKVEALREKAGETEWVKHPTFAFGFSASSFNYDEAIFDIFQRHIEPFEQEYGITPEGHIGTRLATLIRTAYARDGVRPVILVDEYDNPLTDTLAEKDRELHLHYKKELRGFYKAIKECTGMLSLVVITGITQFADLSLFSGINQLRNMSFDTKYAALFGITQEELVENFPEEITRLSTRYGLDFDGMVAELQEHYDGYRFTEADVHVYNPQSIIFAFDANHIEPFWAQSGTSSLLATVFPSYDYDFEQLRQPVRISLDRVRVMDPSGADPIPLLYQSGYLTIIDYRLRTNIMLLDFPNREVRSAFWEVVLPLYNGARKSRVTSEDFVAELEDGKPENALLRLEALVAGIPYSTYGKKGKWVYEELVQTALYAWFNAMGVMVQTEVHSFRGRADVVIHFERTIYIFELKVGPRSETAVEALEQIHQQGYMRPYLGQGKQVVPIGVSIDTRDDTRGNTEWAIGQAEGQS